MLEWTQKLTELEQEIYLEGNPEKIQFFNTIVEELENALPDHKSLRDAYNI